MKHHKTKTWKWILAIIVIAILASIATSYYQKSAQKKEDVLLQQAANYGYQQAVIQILSKASECEPVPVYAGNFSLSLIAVECLQQVSEEGLSQ